MLRLIGLLLPMIPFGFGLARAVETEGQDLRYLWVALAAFAGGMLRLSMARSRSAAPITRAALAAGVFIVSSAFAVVAAILLGTSVNLAVFVVATAFGACFALGAYVSMGQAKRP
jgi:hypothetical protein